MGVQLFTEAGRFFFLLFPVVVFHVPVHARAEVNRVHQHRHHRRNRRRILGHPPGIKRTASLP